MTLTNCLIQNISFSNILNQPVVSFSNYLKYMVGKLVLIPVGNKYATLLQVPYS